MRFGEYKQKFIFKLMFYLTFKNIKLHTSRILEKVKEAVSNAQRQKAVFV